MWQPVKAEISCLVVCIYHAGPLLFDSVVHQDVQSEWHLIHVSEVVGMDVFVGNLFTTIEAEGGQVFLVVSWMLLRHGSPCADG